MAIFQPAFVVADNSAVIAIREIESMNFSRGQVDMSVDKLRGDAVIDIITTSGREYTISAVRQIEILGKQYNIPCTALEVRDAIFARWAGLIDQR